MYIFEHQCEKVTLPHLVRFIKSNLVVVVVFYDFFELT